MSVVDRRKSQLDREIKRELPEPPLHIARVAPNEVDQSPVDPEACGAFGGLVPDPILEFDMIDQLENDMRAKQRKWAN